MPRRAAPPEPRRAAARRVLSRSCRRNRRRCRALARELTVRETRARRLVTAPPSPRASSPSIASGQGRIGGQIVARVTDVRRTAPRLGRWRPLRRRCRRRHRLGRQRAVHGRGSAQPGERRWRSLEATRAAVCAAVAATGAWGAGVRDRSMRSSRRHAHHVGNSGRSESSVAAATAEDGVLRVTDTSGGGVGAAILGGGVRASAWTSGGGVGAAIFGRGGLGYGNRLGRRHRNGRLRFERQAPGCGRRAPAAASWVPTSSARTAAASAASAAASLSDSTSDAPRPPPRR